MFFLNSSCDVSLSGFYVSTCETPAVFHQVKAADSLFCFTLDDVIGVTLTHTHTLFHNLKLFWTRLWRHQSNCSIVSGTQNGCRLKCKWGELSADRSDWHAAFTWRRETFNIIFKYKSDKAQCENSAHHGSVFQCFSVFTLVSSYWAELTLKVDLLHDVLGLHALLLVEDEDLSFIVLCPAELVHPDLHLRVCTNTDRRQEEASFT